jgi:hypothetical protein
MIAKTFGRRRRISFAAIVSAYLGRMDIPACKLSDTAGLARAAEFSQLFAETVRGVERPEATRLRLELEPGPGPARRTAELISAETECCSFFTFTLTATAGSLVLQIAVPPAQVAVLDALAERAGSGQSG